MKIRSLTHLIMIGLLGSGLASFSAAQEPADTPAAHDLPARTPAGVASGYPPAGGKGPGSGHSYQTGTGGPGQGSPQYQGGRDAKPAATADPASGDTRNDTQPASTIDAAADEPVNNAEPAPAVPGPYGNTADQGQPYYSGNWDPYSRGRGYGYGRYQRGYGYGYPGYRGLGGGRYPHHRQFGNPPVYHPAQPAAGEQSAGSE
ncbi:MAG: hypothetical protein WBO34_09645 [Gammaproteobacteria bacterium]